MKFVHRHCLDTWRASGPANARFECPQCRYRYVLIPRTKLSAWPDRRWVEPLLTVVLFLLVLAVCTILSYHLISVALIPIANAGSSVGIWTVKNMLNSVVVIGCAGIVYSLVVDGASILLVYQFNPLSCPGVFTVCILAGVGRAIAAIHSVVSSRMPTAGDQLMHFVVDICDVDDSERSRNSAT